MRWFLVNWNAARLVVEPLSALGARVGTQIETWASRLSADGATAKRTVIWGGGSKAVAFLAALQDRIDIAGVVDINPLKLNTYLPKVADRIVVMNPAYEAEVQAELRDMGLGPELLILD